MATSTSLRAHAGRIAATSRDSIGRSLDAFEDLTDVSDRARGLWRTITPLGRTVAVIGFVTWIVGWWLGWLELMIIAGACLVVLVMALVFVLGRSSVRIGIHLDPGRVTVGDPSAGEVTVENTASRYSAPLQVELPIGEGLAMFDVPALSPHRSHSELFVIPTERRGVIAVGPATSVRGDPLGLLSRKASSSHVTELIVHPLTVPLEPFGSGLLRDLEGQTTKDLSVSDLAFHALREYVPGDDRRHIHWRSSVKAGHLLVRQFQDTRRSTLCVLVDGQESGYGDPEEFEIALQVAGSIALRACKDQLPAVLVAADQAATGAVPHVLLDALARAELGRSDVDLASVASRASSREADISVALVVTGSLRDSDALRRTVVRFPPDVRVVCVRVVPDARPSIRTGAREITVELSSLAQLPGLLRYEVAA